MEIPIKQIHNISRPGSSSPVKGDEIEIECVGGMLKAVDPVTRKTLDTSQRFVITSSGGLKVK